MRFFLPLVADLPEPQSRLLLYFNAVLLEYATQATPALLDIDVAEGSAALAATLETSRKGVIYEHEPASLPARRFAAALRRALAALSPEASRMARMEEDTAVVLRRIEQGARTAADVLAGDDPPVFVGVVRRLIPEAAGGAGAAEAPPAPGGSLIIP